MISLRSHAFSLALTRLASATLILMAACQPRSSDVTEPPLPRPVFQENFEAVRDVADLFPATGSRWHGFQIQPASNDIEVTTARSRTGAQSLLCAAVAGPGASKADIYLDSFHLGEGDAAWFEWWVWLDEWAFTEDMYIWDLEAPTTCTDSVSCPAPGAGTICSSPGRRLYVGGADERLLASDLGKWCTGDIMQQIPERAVPLPLQSWVRLRVHIVLSSHTTGRLEVWQNDVKVLDATGTTLPRSDSVYERMQIGITQNGSDFVTNAIFVDDVSVWLENPGW
jgi:Polysaccharide lyase